MFNSDTVFKIANIDLDAFYKAIRSIRRETVVEIEKIASKFHLLAFKEASLVSLVLAAGIIALFMNRFKWPILGSM